MKQKTIKCPKCNKRTSDEKQFCQHCLFNVHYASFYSMSSPPWVIRADPHLIANDADANTAYTEAVMEEKRKWTQGGHWAAWEKTRKERVMKNKSEWIRRGATPQDRDEAMKG